MSGVFGKNIKISLFGESHGSGVGALIDGFPSGIVLNYEFIESELKRRCPSDEVFSTGRKETDGFEILSGVCGGRTNGNPVCVFFRNNDTEKRENPEILRPSHYDLSAFLKHGENADFSGGGHSSGRLTAPLVFAGALAKQLLNEKNIDVSAKIISVGGKTEKKEIDAALLSAKNSGDSLGGVLECVIKGCPFGLGSPLFGSAKSLISSAVFAIPAVNGLEFGIGFGGADKKGSEINDEIYIEDDKLCSFTNNCGGILGGTTNGEDIVFRVSIKPTPTISKEQRTVNIKTMENTVLKAESRNDVCIAFRALPVVEAAAALSISDLLYDRNR